jgi:hypothetical protein
VNHIRGLRRTHTPNFTFEDYLQMCRDGEAKFSLSEACRLLGWSRQMGYRAMILASVSEEEFEALMDELAAAGRSLSVSNLASEIRRRARRSGGHSRSRSAGIGARPAKDNPRL